MVRALLNGRFENTAFCMFAPDGKTRLTKTGRSPQMVFNVKVDSTSESEETKRSNATVVKNLEKIATKYPLKNSESLHVLQDFHSFKQALNVASGDQRLLIYAVADSSEKSSFAETLRIVANHNEVLGRYHFDIAGKDDTEWSKAIDGDTLKTGIFVIQAGEFGQSGEILAELSLDSNDQTIRAVLAQCNQQFAQSTLRKDYGAHVSKGRKSKVSYQDNMPWGEDRDADGEIDQRSGKQSRK